MNYRVFKTEMVFSMNLLLSPLLFNSKTNIKQTKCQTLNKP